MRAFSLDTLRAIKGSLGRFIAIAAIVALGTGFYSGLRMTCPDMKLGADQYYDGTHLMDIRVVSTLGLTDADIDALRGLDGVEGVMGAYETDVMVTFAGEQFPVRVHSLPGAAHDAEQTDAFTVESDDADYLNRLQLVSGSWPAEPGECVVSNDKVMNNPLSLGDTIVIDRDPDEESALTVDRYEVVGFVHSPYYTASAALGTTALGSGSLMQYLYVPPEDFSADLPYTEAFIAVDGARERFNGSDEYRQRVDEVVEEINTIAPIREAIRLGEVRAEARHEIADAQRELDDQRSEAERALDEARNQLSGAAALIASYQRQITVGQASYEDGLAQLEIQSAAAQRTLNAAAAELFGRRQELASAAETLAASKSALDAGWASYHQGEAALAQAEAGLARIDDGIAAANAAIASAEQAIATLPAAIEALITQVAALQAAVDAGDASQAPALEAAKAQLAEAESALAQAEAALPQAQATRERLEAQRPEVAATVDALQSQLAGALPELQQNQAAYDQGLAAYNAGAAQLADAEASLAAGRAQAAETFAAGRAQLAAAAEQLASGRAQLAEARAERADGQTQLNDKENEVAQMLADAERQIENAQARVAEIAAPTWLVMDRTKNAGAATFSADVDRIDRIASIFPLIFFLVAALVALTTMTRMVEEERTLIGTFKALGYSTGRIASKYLIYAGAASLIGSIVGILVLTQVLPATIMYAYTIMYYVPTPALPFFSLTVLVAAALGIGVTLIATAAAVVATVRTDPATLMLPKTPKAGKRILLERIGPIWRRFSFSWKVTARNLFRYKKRFVMTVIGIAGCTALLLTGLGLSNAINDILDIQFGELVSYNVIVTSNDDISVEDIEVRDEAIADAKDDGDETPTVAAASNAMIGVGADGAELSVTVVSPEDPAAFQELLVFRTREGHTPITLDDDSVVITEKIASKLGVGVGDELELAVTDELSNATNERYKVKIDAIMENYIANYAFIGPQRYADVFGHAPDDLTIYAKVTADPEVRDDLNGELQALDGVRTVTYNDESIDTYRRMIRSVNMIVVVLVVSAAALAFIVLYNLTNINITERSREIATLKVLGFTPLEVDLYMYREIMILSIIGCVIGLGLGIFLESFVVVTAEVDAVMFGRTIHWLSFLIAFGLTIAFTLFVMFVMRGKLAHIDMVESLKSNE